MARTAEVMTTRRERRTAAAQRTVPELRTISDRDVRLLDQLQARRSSRSNGGWATVRQLGGAEKTFHAAALSKLAAHGLVERAWKTTERGEVLHSKITDKGQRVLRAVLKVG